MEIRRRMDYERSNHSGEPWRTKKKEHYHSERRHSHRRMTEREKREFKERMERGRHHKLSNGYGAHTQIMSTMSPATLAVRRQRRGF